jgi:competence protein ComEA
MRSRPTPDARTADVARRRLEALTAELIAARGETAADVEDRRENPDEPAEVGALAPSGSPAAGGRHARRPVPVPRRAVDRAADLTPAGARSLLGGRPHLGAAQVGLVALVVALGLLLSAWWLVRASGAGPGEVAPPRVGGAVPTTPSTPSTPATPSLPAASGAPSPTAGGPESEQSIVVDVVGKVRRPGIAVLPVGARVVDAVRAAGGVRRGVDPATVNMARLLSDGEQVVVGGPAGAVGAAGTLGTPGTAAGSGPAPPSGGLVNLNTADQATLETLPGVGPVTAAAILEWRAQHGAFTSVDELLEVSGIGDATLAEIAPHVTL